MKTVPKLHEMGPAVTPIEVEIISFLRAALAVPVSKISFYSLKNTPEEEHSHHPAGFPHLKAQLIIFVVVVVKSEGSKPSEVSH